MAEIAEDIIDGSCCALCGQYFVDMEEGATEITTDENGVANNAAIHSHGFPVACKECWEPGCGYQKAKANTF